MKNIIGFQSLIIILIMNPLTSSLCICLLVASCMRKISSEEQLYQRIDATFSKNMTLRLSDFAESIELIPLQTCSESMISNIVKIILFENKYYIASGSMKTKEILVFDSSGNYMAKLDKSGRGNDEYIDITDFAVMEDLKILVVSRSSLRMLLYDINMNVCVMNKRLDVFPKNIIVGKELIYMLISGYVSASYKERSKFNFLREFDFQGETIDSYCKPSEAMWKKISNVKSPDPFVLCADQLYFSHPWCDTIYEIKNKKMISAFYVDFGHKKIPESIFSKNIDDVMVIMREIKKHQGVQAINSFNVTPDVVYFTFLDFENNGYIAFYHRESNQTYIGRQVIDDMLFTGRTLSDFSVIMVGEDLIGFVDSDQLKRDYQNYKKRVVKEDWDKFCEKHTKIVAICENLKEEDNPVLIKIRINLQNKIM